MGRLIREDDVMHMLTGVELNNGTITDAKIELRNVKTAYDISKVVAELVQFGLNSMDKQIYDSDTYYDGVSVAIRKACNIVKRGGVDG